MKKYELTEETKALVDGTVLHRIRAVSDFSLFNGTKVRADDLGGWVEREDNLSQDGKAWVGGEACVCGKASVSGKAWVYGEARVYDEAKVCGEACVCGKAWVYGEARVYDEAKVCGEAEVCGKASVSDKAWVYGKAKVCGEAEVYGEASVSGKAWVYGKARVCCKAEVCGEASVSGICDYTVYKNTWSSGRWFTYTRSNRMWKVGCFYGTGEELIAKAYKDSELSGRCYEAVVRAQEAIDREIEEKEEKK